MKTLERRIHKLEETIRPHGLSVIVAHTRKEAEQKIEEFVKNGGNPQNLVVLIAAKIEKEFGPDL